MKHKAKLISIITEKVFENAAIAILNREEVRGYTLFEGGGNGSFHLHQQQHLSMVDEFKIIKIEAIILDEEKAERLAENMTEHFFSDKPGIVALSDVDVFRTQKF